MSAIISVDNLSKSYLIGHQGPRERYQSLRDTVAHGAKQFGRRALDTVRGRQSLAGDSVEEFWALKDVSFEVKEGEVLGVIGRNGAGKSTLLKVLSRITEPSSGRVTLRGRVASLLEVGTGFHPELTGRENIFLNGAILGMSRAEIKRKFDEIVDFAGVEKFLDTPVKRYSSGMYVRLAFAVAAHLEPEILVVDEVLAVGDAEFQKKCMGKMKDVAEGGRTVLFVSHSMAAISALCNRTIMLQSGQIYFDGETEMAVQSYLNNGPTSLSFDARFEQKSQNFWLKRATVESSSGEIKGTFNADEAIQLRFNCEVDNPPRGIDLSLNVASARGFVVFTSDRKSESWQNGDHEICCTIPASFLTPGIYNITLAAHIPNISLVQIHEHALGFTIEETGSGMEHYQGADFGAVIAPCRWD